MRGRGEARIEEAFGRLSASATELDARLDRARASVHLDRDFANRGLSILVSHDVNGGSVYELLMPVAEA